jgi:hypothetical protein
MTETMQRLRERLQTGWQPTAAEIPAEVPQRLMRDWDWWKSGDTLLGFRSTMSVGRRSAFCGSTRARAGPYAPTVFGGLAMTEFFVVATPLISVAIALYIASTRWASGASARAWRPPAAAECRHRPRSAGCGREAKTSSLLIRYAVTCAA